MSEIPQFIGIGVPNGWRVVPIRHIGVVNNGATPSSGEERYWDGEIVWITPDDLGKQTSRYISDSGRKITREGYSACGTTLVPARSLVLSTRAPIGHLAITTIDACFNQGCRSITLQKGCIPEYFYYQLLVAKDDLASLGTGSTFMELGRDRLCSFKLLVPPEDVQREIVVFLDREVRKIDGLIEDIAGPDWRVSVEPKTVGGMLGTLFERRFALIAGAVTGRIARPKGEAEGVAA